MNSKRKTRSGFCRLKKSAVVPLLLLASFLAACGTLPLKVPPQPSLPTRSLKIVAHRGGTADAPENTLYAARLALRHGADILWFSVQLTSDGIPILYRPRNLSVLTNGRGIVREIPLSTIRKLNAGFHFKQMLPNGQVIFPFRNRPLTIPTLREVLEAIPPQIPIFLDMKAPPAVPLVHAVAQVLEDTHAWSRVRIYSTDLAHTQAWRAYPKARLFEDRGTSRQRLVDLMLGNRCIPPPPGTWVGIELTRPLELIEHFTLGKGISKSVAHWWTPEVVRCHRKLGRVNIVIFGIDNRDSYQQAKQLGVDAVMTDSPAHLQQWSTPAL